MQITLTIQKSKVIEEVSQTTEYTGDKMTGDGGAYDRIRTVDEDNTELDRFWNECRADIAKTFKRQLVSEDMYATANASSPSTSGDYYKLALEVSSKLGAFGGGFNSSLQPSMQLSLFSFFVQGITARWYVYANKGEAQAYATKAAALLEELYQNALSQTKPTRPTYS